MYSLTLTKDFDKARRFQIVQLLCFTKMPVG